MPGNIIIDLIDTDERVVEIELERLREFKDHPFKVKKDQEMKQLMDSISRYGILNPLIVRPLPEGVYEIVSGNRRRFAAQELGYRKVPVIIRLMKDEEAVINMVNSNLHREKILPSEKAFAYKMKYDAMKRKAGRKNSSRMEDELIGKRTVQIMGEETGDSPKQVQRYLKITELVPEMLEKLDKGQIAFNPAFECAFLREVEQQNLVQAMEYAQASPSISQAQRLKKLSKEGNLTYKKMKHILSEVKRGDTNRVMFKNEQLYCFFPRNYTPEQMKTEILELLRHRQEQNQGTGQPV